jgi:hypothetical protein
MHWLLVFKKILVLVCFVVPPDKYLVERSSGKSLTAAQHSKRCAFRRSCLRKNSGLRIFISHMYISVSYCLPGKCLAGGTLRQVFDGGAVLLGCACRKFCRTPRHDKSSTARQHSEEVRLPEVSSISELLMTWMNKNGAPTRTYVVESQPPVPSMKAMLDPYTQSCPCRCLP